MQSLENELESYSSKSNYFDFSKLKTLYIGGGTPSLLSPENLSYLSQIVEKKVLPNYQNNLEEITVECEPGTVSSEKLQVILREINPHRVSIGG